MLLQSTCSYDFFLRKKFLFENFIFLSSRTTIEKISNFVKHFSEGLSKLHSTCAKERFDKNCFLFGKDVIFCRYRTFSGTFSEFYRKLSARFWKLQFACPLEYFEQKGFRGNSSVVFVFFGPWAKDFWPFVGKFLAGLLKLHSENRCHQFRGKLFIYERSILVLAVSDFKGISFGPLSKTFWRDWDNCLQCVQKNIFTKNVFFWKKKVWHFCQTLSWMYWSFVEKLKTVGEVAKTAFYVPIRMFFFQKKIFFKKECFLFHFATVSDNFSAFRRIFIGENVTTAFFVHIKTLQRSIFSKNYSFWSFLYIERFFWTLCWKLSDEVVKTASYLFIGSSWWEKYFDEKTLMFFNQFETFSEKVWAVCRELFVGLLPFQSTCSKILVLRKKTLFEDFIFSSSRTTIEKLPNFVKQFSEELSKLHSAGP